MVLDETVLQALERRLGFDSMTNKQNPKIIMRQSLF